MLEIIAFLGGSEAASGPAWGVWFLIIFLTYAVPIVVIVGLILLLIRSFRHKQTGNNNNKGTNPRFQLTPYIIALVGLIFIIANIAGSKYSEKSIALDTILLALPFTFGALASHHSFKQDRRTVFLILTFVTAFIFLYSHYPRWFNL